MPGYNNYAHDLLGESFLPNKQIFNPWSHNYLVNQLDLNSDTSHEQSAWNEISNKLSQCDYKKLTNLPSNYNGSPRILSLNIRELAIQRV